MQDFADQAEITANTSLRAAHESSSCSKNCCDRTTAPCTRCEELRVNMEIAKLIETHARLWNRARENTSIAQPTNNVSRSPVQSLSRNMPPPTRFVRRDQRRAVAFSKLQIG